MRTSFAVAAGLLAVASAGTTTITDTVDVTITSCEPTVTNCPYKGGAATDGTWSDWVSATTTKPVKPASTSTYDPSWSDWSESTTTTKPVSPATTSSYHASWSDWTSTWATTATPVSPASTYASGAWSSVAAISVASYSASATPVKPATFTGAANVNAGSFALAGLAAAAVLVIA